MLATVPTGACALVLHRRAVATLLAVLLACPAAEAATKTWIGPANGGVWSTAANWSPSGVPGPGDDVVVNGAATTILHTTGTSTVNSITSAGKFIVTGGKLTVNTTATCAGVTLNGGTLEGGTWTWTSPMEAKASTANRLANVTINGDMSFSESSATVRILNVIFNGTATVTGHNAEIGFEGTQTFSKGTIAANSLSGAAHFKMLTPGTLTLGPDVLIHGGGMSVGNHSTFLMSLVNQGTIVADIPNMSIGVDPADLVNQGTIKAVAGTARIYSANWKNDGGSLIAAGGVVSLGGYLDNTGMTQHWGGADGSLYMDNVTIEGGTIEMAPPAELNTSDDNFNRLKNLTYNGVINVNESTGRIRINNIALNGTLKVTGSNAQVFMEGTQSLTSGTIEFDYPISASRPNIIMTSAGTTLTLGPDVVVKGGYGIIGKELDTGPPSTPMTLINHGTITSDVPGREIRLEPVAFENDGDLHVVPGARMEVRGAWSNTGSIDVQAGELYLGGTTTTASLDGLVNAGSVALAGAIDNSGATLVLDRQGEWTLDGGAISGGTMAVPDEWPLQVTSNDNNSLAGVHFVGDLDLAAFGSKLKVKNVELDGVARLRAASARLNFDGTQTFSKGTVELLYQGTSSYPSLTMSSTGTLTLGPDAVVRGGNGAIGIPSGGSAAPMTLVNQGTIQADVPARSIFLNAATVTNAGTVQSKGGLVSVLSPNVTNYVAASKTLTGGKWLALSNSFISWPAATIRTLGPGTTVALEGQASVFNAVNGLTSINPGATFALAGGRDFAATPFGGAFSNGGTLTLGAGSGLTVNGSFSQSATGQLLATIGSAADPAPIVSSGNIGLDGGATVAFGGGFAPAPGVPILLANSTGGVRSGTFASFSHPFTRICAMGTQYGPSSAAVVLDGAAPVALCKPATITVSAGGVAELTIADVDAGSNDDCNVAGMFLSRTTFGCDAVGTQSVTLTVVDEAGNVSTCDATVTVNPYPRFVGAAGGSWADADNWCGGPPTATWDVTVATAVVVDAPGAVAQSVVVQPGGQLTVGPADGASLSVIGTLTVQAGGTLRITSPTALLAVGDLVLMPGATFEWSAGTLEVAGSLVTDLNLDVGCSGAPAVLRLIQATVAAPALTVCTDGALVGTGDVQCPVTSAGLVEPGLGPNALAVAADAVLQPGGTFSVLLAAGSQGADGELDAGSSRLVAAGTASIAGALEAQLIDGFTPVWGASFEVLTASAVNGSFSSVTLPKLTAPLYFVARVEPARVTLLVRTAGDANDDGTVDESDVALVLEQWGPCDGCAADLNGDGVVNGADLGLVLGWWGRLGGLVDAPSAPTQSASVD